MWKIHIENMKNLWYSIKEVSNRLQKNKNRDFQMDYLERSKSWIEARTANNCKRMQKAAKDVQKAVKGAEKAPGTKERAKSTGKKEEKP